MTDDVRTDEALLSATAAGDDAAFAVLVRRHVRGATLLAAQFVGRRDAAEDVAQDAFLVVYRKAHAFDVTRRFSPWFFAVVRRLATNRRARDWRRERLFRLWRLVGRSESESSRSEAMLNAGLDAETARRAMESLPLMQRSCFTMIAVHGFSTAEVAAMNGIDESTVRQHVYRARIALRRTLDPAQNDGASDDAN